MVLWCSNAQLLWCLMTFWDFFTSAVLTLEGQMDTKQEATMMDGQNCPSQRAPTLQLSI